MTSISKNKSMSGLNLPYITFMCWQAVYDAEEGGDLGVTTPSNRSATLSGWVSRRIRRGPIAFFSNVNGFKVFL